MISSSVVRHNTQLSVAKHNKYVDITEIKESLKLATSLLKPAVYKARSKNQESYVECLNDPNVSMVFGVGPAGCGKTLFAVISAITALKKGDISKIILTRPIVSVEEELGFLPGDISNKMNPWLQPLFDIFLEHYTQIEMDKMIAEGVIEISPLGFMRGRTFKRTFVICDELQNSTPSQMLMLLTRAGMGCKMVITGDLKQSDLKGKNGLADFIEKYRTRPRDYSEIRLVEMTAKDVERSEVVKNILEMYNKESDVVKPVSDMRPLPPTNPNTNNLDWDWFLDNVITKPNTLLASGMRPLPTNPNNNLDWDTLLERYNQNVDVITKPSTLLASGMRQPLPPTDNLEWGDWNDRYLEL
jgi:phosphate starvation-inducible PhoH-like protein